MEFLRKFFRRFNRGRMLPVLNFFDLRADASNKMILSRAEMGGEENARQTMFRREKLSKLIDELLLLQPDGKEGLLISNGRPNLFYYIDTREGLQERVSVVSISFLSHPFERRKWVVSYNFVFDKGKHVAGRWRAGARVFINHEGC